MRKDGTIVVLCLDDRDVELLAEVIQNRYGPGIEVLTASNIGEAHGAIEGVSKTQEAIDVLITDVYLEQGKPSGIHFAREMKDRFPVIFISAYPQSTFKNEMEDLNPLGYQEKPIIRVEELCDQIRHAIELKSPGASAHQTFFRTLNARRSSGTVMSARFVLSDLRENEARFAAGRRWDIARLALGLTHLEACVTANGARPVYRAGNKTLAFLSDHDAPRGHFAQTLAALSNAHREIGDLQSRNLRPALFGAGVVPGDHVIAFLDRSNPNRWTLTGPLIGVAEAIADEARSGEVGTVMSWLETIEQEAFASINIGERSVAMYVSGIVGEIEVTYKQL